MSPTKKPATALEGYRGKRNFDDTPEPRAKKAMSEGRSFVVQEHHARSHHFDFRLEMDGVLKSWAVPKGIPEDEAAKRLAVHVEDHPLDYGSFEGTIPKGNYGAGTVAIWDRGTWEPLTRNWQREFDHGKIKFILHGERLQGTYLLVRMKEEPNWLLRKLDDAIPPDHTPPPPREEAAFVAPQLARVTSSVPAGEEWWHELKFDGYRLIAVKRGGKVTLYTRSKLDWTDRFGDLADHLAALTQEDFVLDGEAVVFDQQGRSRFGDLQDALKTGHQERILFVAFDLLHLDGRNLRTLPLSQRFDQLTKLVGEGSARLRLSKVWPPSEGAELFRQACANGLEGIISKKSGGRYLEGSRRDWLKSKCRPRQEFVICGYTAPKGSLRGFGALLLASFENGKLIPRGKVGTGFSDRERLRLVDRFKPMVVKKPTLPEAEAGVTWLRPELVAEVEFAEITREGAIRQGSFVALREDKSATEIHLDAIATTSPRGKPMTVAGIPDQLIWDLDPDPAVPWPEVLGTAFLIRDFLAEQGLQALVKTSGGKGLHLVLFIKRTHDWDSMREFTKTVARQVAAFNPSRLVITSSKKKRHGKIFIDWMRNGEGSTCIAPWSLRARDGAAVSMPVAWSELATTTADGFTIHEPLKPPVEWLDPQPQLIPKALLKRLASGKAGRFGQ